MLPRLIRLLTFLVQRYDAWVLAKNYMMLDKSSSKCDVAEFHAVLSNYMLSVIDIYFCVPSLSLI